MLLVYLALALSIPTTATISTAQTTQNNGTGSKLIIAYQAVQKAENLGAPTDQVAKLTAQLNNALAYYNTANNLASQGNATAAEYFALSNNTSTIVTAQALILQTEAENNRTNQLLAAYFTAIIAAAVSALFILEIHQIPNFIRKRRLLSTRLRSEDSNERRS